MVKTITISFVAAIAAALAGYYLCQSEAFVLHYSAMVFITVYGATGCTVLFWDDLDDTLEGYDKESRRSIISDNIAFTVIAWLLPVSLFLIGILHG